MDKNFFVILKYLYYYKISEIKISKNSEKSNIKIYDIKINIGNSKGKGLIAPCLSGYRTAITFSTFSVNVSSASVFRNSDARHMLSICALSTLTPFK